MHTMLGRTLMVMLTITFEVWRGLAWSCTLYIMLLDMWHEGAFCDDAWEDDLLTRNVAWCVNASHKGVMLDNAKPSIMVLAMTLFASWCFTSWIRNKESKILESMRHDMITTMCWLFTMILENFNWDPFLIAFVFMMPKKWCVSAIAWNSFPNATHNWMAPSCSKNPSHPQRRPLEFLVTEGLQHIQLHAWIS